MDTGVWLDVFFSRLLWSLPITITAVVIGIIAIVRRDDRLWWKLVLAGAICLVLAQLVGVVVTVLLVSNGGFHHLQRLLSVPTIALDVAALGLLGAGALSGRRPASTP